MSDTPNILTRAEREAAQARCDAATGGRWWHQVTGDHEVGIIRATRTTGHPVIATIESTDADGTFIATAHRDLPRALATIDALMWTLTGCVESLEEMLDASGGDDFGYQQRCREVLTETLTLRQQIGGSDDH